MVIGYLGRSAGSGIQFIVSREVFRTPNNMTWGGSARYSTHERHVTHALTEFTGLDPDSFSFDMLLTAELGVNPLEELNRLWAFERTGEALGLVIGGCAYGKCRWVIQKHEIKMNYTDKTGNLYAVEVSVELLEYFKGESHNTTKATAASTSEAGTQSAETASTGGSGYTVKKGDCLWTIAEEYYGDGSQWRKIYDANQDVIGGNPDLIYPGQVFAIPAA